MSGDSIERHLDDLRRAKPEHYDLVQGVRAVVGEIAPDASQSVMYGGIMFAAPVSFCGVFSYTEHVSVEFTRGFELDDPAGVLEGGGKLRRHIKLRLPGDVEAKHVRDYVADAYERMVPE